MRLSIAFLVFCWSVFGQMVGLVSPGPGTVHATGGGGTCTPRSGYSHCRVLTFDHTQMGGSTLTSFPVVTQNWSTPMTLGSSRIQNANCYDVVFTSDSGGTTLIPWELETCNQGTGAVIAHVLCASCSSTSDTTLYVSYGNASISTAQNSGANGPTHVWDLNYAGVWHLGGASLNANDSTSNGFNGSATGATAGTGQIGGSAHFNSTSDVIDVSTFSNFSRPMTIECWTNATPGKGLVQAATYSGNFILYGNSARIGFSIQSGMEMNSNVGTGIVLDGNWHHIVATVDASGNGVIYSDGVLQGSGTGLVPHTSTALKLGNGYQNMNGKDLDEVRVSNISRPAGWILAEYNNQKTGSTFLTVGAEI